ncbi:uncharacterized protein LOC108742903 [Agrilus planipennis]|uniref:Uncharacterized protein LOC108742903 n=1 Tax=Agrilus planipennis TaxID=224129 RepID=A0A1W4XCM9_AGRPL|nr:uncharacterized protein LOC108742903 [Agrilus planipennis]
MSPKCVVLAFFVVVVAVSARTVSVAEENVIPHDTPRGSSSLLDELRFAYNVYRNCDGDSSCLKLKLVTTLDRAARSVSDYSFMGVKFVKDPNAPSPPEPQPESEIADQLPRSLEDKEDKLNALIVDKIGSFLSTHSLQVELPSVSDLQRAFSDDEGRAKKKKLSGLLTLPLLLGGALIPLVLGGLALLAGKALLTAKVALLLAGIIAFKKLFGGSTPASIYPHDSHEVVVPSGHIGSGWGRSYNKEPQKMAYSAYAPNSTQQ